ncbi:MAG: hypothetical protein RLZZ474_1252, partial [Bacteroidota bacterium]
MTLQTDLQTNPTRTNTSLQLQVSEQGIRLQEADLITWKQAKAGLAKSLKSSGIDNAQLQTIEVSIIHPAFLLLPKDYHDPLYRIAFLEKALGEHCMDGNELHEQACESVDSILLFLVPSAWKDQLAIYFPLANIQYKHQLGIELNRSKLYIHPRIQVYLQENHAYISYFQHGRLQLVNVFPYEHELALAFYLHSIRDTFDIQWNQESIQLQGPGASDTQMIADLIRLNIPLP